MHFPVLESFENCVQPLTDSGFTCVDFLPTTDEAYDNGPISVTINAGNQEFRFGLIEAGSVFFSRHEVCCLLQRPSTLRFIEENNVFRWCARICEAVIAEVMYVLDECGDLLTRFSLSYRDAFN